MNSLKSSLALFSLLLLCAPAFAATGKFYIPAQVPVNIKPSIQDQTLFGVGYNRLGVKTEWSDNFFTSTEEEVGTLEVTANNAAFGIIKNKSERYSVEWDFIVGSLKLENETQSYTSGIIGKTVNVDADGSGFDIGLRYLGGYSLAKQEFANGRSIDWNLAIGLHAAFYHLGTEYKANSTDGLDINEYKASENGLFVRPVIALQPIIQVFEGLSLVPFVGTNTTLLLGFQSFEDTKFVRNGSSGFLDDDFGASFSLKGLELIFGFDLGFSSPISREHKVTLGGALSKLVGGGGGDFSEFHLMYAMPWK